MQPFFFKLINFANQTCRIILPRGIYIRLRWVSKQLLLKYLNEPNNKKEIPFTKSNFVMCDGRQVSSNFSDKFELDGEQEECDLVLCCAFIGRHKILKQIIIESLASKNGKNIRWMLVGSKDEDFDFILSMAKSTGCVAGFLARNSPLGVKWNACIINAGRYYNSKIYGITGSDDIISSKLIDSVLSKYSLDNNKDDESVPSLYASLDWLVYVNKNENSLRPKIYQCRYNAGQASQPIGAGRFYSRKFMKEVSFNIFDEDKSRQLDDRGYKEIINRNRKINYLSIDDGLIISVKGDWEQLNSINDFFASLQLNIHECSQESILNHKTELSASTCKYLFDTIASGDV